MQLPRKSAENIPAPAPAAASARWACAAAGAASRPHVSGLWGGWVLLHGGTCYFTADHLQRIPMLPSADCSRDCQVPLGTSVHVPRPSHGFLHSSLLLSRSKSRHRRLGKFNLSCTLTCLLHGCSCATGLSTSRYAPPSAAAAELGSGTASIYGAFRHALSSSSPEPLCWAAWMPFLIASSVVPCT